MSEKTDILVWILDSVDIIHAVIKWDVLPTIEDPKVKFPSVNSTLETELQYIYTGLKAIQTFVQTDKKYPSQGPSEEMTLNQQSRTIRRTLQANQGSDPELSCVKEWLYNILQLLHENTEPPELSKYRQSTIESGIPKQMNKIHKRLTTIKAKSQSLKYKLLEIKGSSSQEQEPIEDENDIQNQSTNAQVAACTQQVDTNEGDQTGKTEFESVKKDYPNNQIKGPVLTDDKATQTYNQDTESNKESNKRATPIKKEAPSKREQDRFKTKVDQITAELDKIRYEKEALEKRLSEAFSAQLKNNNPVIADLGDPTRPTIIAEKYNQLYDDEWTDGYQALCQTGKTERDRIEILLNTMKGCHEFCLKQEQIQGTKIVTALTSFESKALSNNRAGFHKTTESLGVTSKSTLNELRRQTSVMSKECLINEYFEETKDDPQKKQLVPYIEKCLELCWYMVLQSPAVYMDRCDAYKKGCVFNKEVFRHYSRSGKKFDFVVWPPLYLHKDGPLLVKGVAQPIA